LSKEIKKISGGIVVIVTRLHTLIAFKIRIPVLLSNSLAEKYTQNQEIGV
jgi:hypothetical protein